MTRVGSWHYAFRNAPYHVHGGLTAQWGEFLRASRDVTRSHGATRVGILRELMDGQWRYGFTPKDLLALGLLQRPKREWKRWVGTVDMYKAQRFWNPSPHRSILSDKRRFSKHFSGLMDGRRFHFERPKDLGGLEAWIRETNSKELISKPAQGQAGRGVLVHRVSFERGAMLLDGTPNLERALTGLTLPRLFEPRLENHPSINEVHSGSLNTVRVLTFRESGGRPHVFAARIRFGCGTATDNMAAGGLAAPVSLSSGTVSQVAVSTGLAGPEEHSRHPLTNVEIVGLKVPHWQAILELAKAAAERTPQTRSVGWDIAVTPQRPVLLEGNHNWCKILWQVPVNQGLRSEVEEMLRA